jgi:hypothetical protein
MKRIVSGLAGMMVVLGVAAGPALAQQAAKRPNPAGATMATRAKVTRLALGTIEPAKVFRKASYGTAGVGLRNRDTGGLTISGVTGPIQAAYLYWAVITQNAPPAAAKKVIIQRNDAKPTQPVTVTGTPVGTGESPCWYVSAANHTIITVYRAPVPTQVATGNGSYMITLLPGASGDTRGTAPLDIDMAFPLMEGASLVIIGTGTATVGLYDTGLAGKTFNCSKQQDLTYSLRLPAAAPNGTVLFDNIGADGQPENGAKTTALLYENGGQMVEVPIAGLGSVVGDSDWNGRAGGTIVHLWDDTTHQLPPIATHEARLLSFLIHPGNDSLTPVANVLAVQ